MRTRQQRWAQLAALWDKPYRERTAAERKQTAYGICYSVHRIFGKGNPMYEAMLGFMESEFPEKYLYLGPTRGFYGYTAKDYDEMDAVRATLCAMFAAMDDEDRAFYFGGVEA